eukprot:SAG31_NODE_827_length_11749_cov_14.363090_3_plen_182_part_00
MPPGPESRRPIDPNKPGYGRGIYAWSIKDVLISNNAVAHGRGPSIAAVGGASHVLIANNLLSDDKFNNTGILIEGSSDVMIHGNNLRGFAIGVGIDTQSGRSDRVHIRGNAIDLLEAGDGQKKHETPGATNMATIGVSVAARTTRVVVADNEIVADSSNGTCVNVQGTNSPTRIVKDNICW